MLTAADLRFVNAVAVRRFAPGGDAAVNEAALAAAVAAQDRPGSPFALVAGLAGALAQHDVFGTAPLQTTLLVLHCALSLEGFVLLAPQGVVAGMVARLAAGDDPGRLAHWLEDRSVPASGG